MTSCASRGDENRTVICLERWGCVFVAAFHLCGSHFGSFCLTSYLECGTGEVVVHAIKAYGVVEV